MIGVADLKWYWNSKIVPVLVNLNFVKVSILIHMLSREVFCHSQVSELVMGRFWLKERTFKFRLPVWQNWSALPQVLRKRSTLMRPLLSSRLHQGWLVSKDLRRGRPLLPNWQAKFKCPLLVSITAMRSLSPCPLSYANEILIMAITFMEFIWEKLPGKCVIKYHFRLLKLVSLEISGKPVENWEDIYKGNRKADHVVE